MQRFGIGSHEGVQMIREDANGNFVAYKDAYAFEQDKKKIIEECDGRGIVEKPKENQ